MVSSINTNLAALLAQTNIANATNATSSQVAALSSGNRIVKASDDVAALAAGTSLQTQVTTLLTALTVASQGSSLLQVADGGLAQIQTILQRQAAIATQANSGQLSSSRQLSFLNQEFQNLTSAIDQLASSTNFNGVKLLNGSVSGKVDITSNKLDGTTTVLRSSDALIALNVTTGAVATNGDTITINGVTITLTTSAPGTSGAVGKVSIGTTAANTATNIASYLNSLGDPRFANVNFVASGATVYGDYAGGKLAGTYNFTVSASFGTSADITATSTTIAAGGLDGIGISRYSVSGEVTGTLLANGGIVATATGAPIDVSNLSKNAAFIGSFGDLGQITAQFNTTDSATFSLRVGDITYSTTATTITGGAAPIALTFTGRNDAGTTTGGSFVIYLKGNAITTSSITGQAALDPITAQLNSAIKDVRVLQTRDVTSFQNGASVKVGGVEVANLSGFTVDYKSDSFSNVSISDIQITAPGTGGTDAIFSVVINGETFTSVSGIGNQINRNKVIGLQSTTDPSKTISLVTGNVTIAGTTGTVALDLSNQSNADAVEAALREAFGLNSSVASLSFQVGSSTTDTIGVSISAASTSVLFGGASVDVLSQANAAIAAGVITSAIDTVTSYRAGVGALQSRFNYASAAIQNAVQNQNAAKSGLLDTDVASASTAFATAQVQLQAGIAVLAQANQLQQNLLKLIA